MSAPALIGFGLAFACLTFSAKAAPPEYLEKENGSSGKWIHHRVTSGERLREISDHYLVSVDKIIRWNDLDSERPWLRVGQKLKIFSNVEPLVRQKVKYTVQPGDSWSRIAKRYEVDQRRLRRYWNPQVPEQLQSGQKIVIWIEPQAPEREKDEVKRKERKTIPVIPVQTFGRSVGRPGNGRIENAVQLPENPLLYTRRNPDHSWGSSHTVENLQKALVNFRRDTGFTREIIICDMSRKRGGRIPPHDSHRSGRDVDIRLPLRLGVAPGTVPNNLEQVDWQAAWGLIRALVETEAVMYIFLERSRQIALYRAAQETGSGVEYLEKIIQYPGRARKSIVRHSRGHIGHIHIRFTCSENEPDCSD
ncbi:MAG: penicillin-insensitive murein endopeptidase [Deltaproteobacteria bacterium]|nr:penicillin-insensitive murein endopeptidase [Deltaproteobacteria bacterium]